MCSNSIIFFFWSINSIIFKHISIHPKVAHPFFTCYFCFEYTLLPFSLYFFIYFCRKNGDNWWQVTVIYSFRARKGYGEFHPARGHNQTNSSSQSIEPRTSHIFLFIGELQSVPLPLSHLLWCFHFHYLLSMFKCGLQSPQRIRVN